MTGIPLTGLEKEEADGCLSSKTRTAQEASSASTRRSVRSPGRCGVVAAA